MEDNILVYVKITNVLSDPSIPLLGNCTTDILRCMWNWCTKLFNGALFVIAKIGSNPNIHQ